MTKKRLLVFLTINYFFINAVLSQDVACTTQEEWNPSSVGPITTWTAPHCGKNKFVVQPYFYYNNYRGVFNSKNGYNSYPDGDKKYQWQEMLYLRYGLTQRIEIDTINNYWENYVKQADLKAHANGFGDSNVYLRYWALDENKWIPCTALIFCTKIPSGKYQHADPNKLGTDLMADDTAPGAWENGAGIILTKRVKPFIFHIDVIYNYPYKVKVDEVKTLYGKYLECDLAAEYFLPKGFSFMLELNGLLQGQKEEAGYKVSKSQQRAFMISPGIGWANKSIQMLLAYQRELLGKNNDASDSVVITCVYTFG